ncbi:hypothetical protein LF1_34360 [Rubripirellula obstinata]|uniref:Uncharacterized protein n=1 Tax=Rubripirellula obstinata TaxID=406547 RepID=A0A5B1CNP6_9BACT|nr:hypothetical protein LF1_34360 [Rubripirellula obstinata]
MKGQNDGARIAGTAVLTGLVAGLTPAKRFPSIGPVAWPPGPWQHKTRPRGPSYLVPIKKGFDTFVFLAIQNSAQGAKLLGADQKRGLTHLFSP